MTKHHQSNVPVATLSVIFQTIKFFIHLKQGFTHANTTLVKLVKQFNPGLIKGPFKEEELYLVKSVSAYLPDS